MVSKKDLVIAVLTTFCLTAALFGILPTRSSGGVYDPWCDINGDGIINISDIAKVATVFGATGDATKPVVIAGYNNIENYTHFVVMNQTLTNITISTAGYRMMTLSLYAQSADAHEFEIFWGYKIAGRFAYSTIKTLTSDTSIHVVEPVWYENVRIPTYMLTYEITFSEFWLSINNESLDRYLTVTLIYSLST